MTTMADAEAESTPAPKAGRNLPAAIGIGVLLAGAVVASLFVDKRAFVGLAVVAIMAAVIELARALRAHAVVLPSIPLAAGAAAVLIAAYAGGTQALVVSTLLLVVAGVVMTVVADDATRSRAMSSVVFVVCYVAFLAGFAILLAVPDDGPRRVLALVATVVCSDTGGYAVGVFFGKHPMAPSVSPKKSWEGFTGSVAACVVCGALYLPLVLHGAWWEGVLFGLAIALAATIGDLAESLIKRALGIKDMGALLPGHGGVMDRIDSLVVAAPVAWALLTAFVPWS
jgi:phosphatidate cytidylyltransferase